MIKKTLIASILAVSILAFSVPAMAADCSDLNDSLYNISGSMTVKVTIKDYATLSVTLPKLDKFHERFWFLHNKTFLDELLFTAYTGETDIDISYPTWSQSGTNFTIDLTGMASSIESALGSYIDLNGGATKSPVITGKIAKGGSSISGSMSLGWNILTSVPDFGNISGSITVTMKYKGVCGGHITYSSLQTANLEKSESEMALQNAVKDAVVNILSSLPKKAEQPAQ